MKSGGKSDPRKMASSGKGVGEIIEEVEDYDVVLNHTRRWHKPGHQIWSSHTFRGLRRTIKDQEALRIMHAFQAPRQITAFVTPRILFRNKNGTYRKATVNDVIGNVRAKRSKFDTLRQSGTDEKLSNDKATEGSNNRKKAPRSSEVLVPLQSLEVHHPVTDTNIETVATLASSEDEITNKKKKKRKISIGSAASLEEEEVTMSDGTSCNKPLRHTIMEYYQFLQAFEGDTEPYRLQSQTFRKVLDAMLSLPFNDDIPSVEEDTIAAEGRQAIEAALSTMWESLTLFYLIGEDSMTGPNTFSSDSSGGDGSEDGFDEFFDDDRNDTDDHHDSSHQDGSSSDWTGTTDPDWSDDGAGNAYGSSFQTLRKDDDHGYEAEPDSSSDDLCDGGDDDDDDDDDDDSDEDDWDDGMGGVISVPATSKIKGMSYHCTVMENSSKGAPSSLSVRLKQGLSAKEEDADYRRRHEDHDPITRMSTKDVKDIVCQGSSDDDDRREVPSIHDMVIPKVLPLVDWLRFKLQGDQQPSPLKKKRIQHHSTSSKCPPPVSSQKTPQDDVDNIPTLPNRSSVADDEDGVTTVNQLSLTHEQQDISSANPSDRNGAVDEGCIPQDKKYVGSCVDTTVSPHDDPSLQMEPTRIKCSKAMILATGTMGTSDVTLESDQMLAPPNAKGDCLVGEHLLMCPISLDVVKDPVLLIAGHSPPHVYDKEHLCKSLLHYPSREPTTGQDYDHPLQYVESKYHRELLIKHYGLNAYVPYDDSVFNKKYRTIWELSQSSKDNMGRNTKPGWAKGVPKALLIDNSETRYDELESLLCGMNSRKIDKEKAFRLTITDSNDPIIMGYGALMLHPLAMRDYFRSNKDEMEAIQLMDAAIHLGLETEDPRHPVAQFLTGCCHRYGIGKRQNYVKAIFWYHCAAYQDHSIAQCNLGSMYENGEGVPKDDTQAVGWYLRSANQGNAQAQYYLGVMYHKGRGVPEDTSMAIYWYQKAAEQGNADAQCSLGSMYENGRGVSKNDAKAIGWYQESANQGNATAKANLEWWKRKLVVQ